MGFITFAASDLRGVGRARERRSRWTKYNLEKLPLVERDGTSLLRERERVRP